MRSTIALIFALQLARLCATDEQPPAESKAISQLKTWLAGDRSERAELASSAFAKSPLTKADAALAHDLLWKDHAAMVRATRKGEVEGKRLKIGDKEMPYLVKTFGEKPAGGRSLYISMHGGGGTHKRVNDQQWRNQIRLYQPAEGIYLAPRAPTDKWNLWHQGHIDALFDRLITNLIVFEEVNPDKVYLMGYSAGGDGVYQLAPRMADRFAAAAMMAGHPNETVARSACGICHLLSTSAATIALISATRSCRSGTKNSASCRRQIRGATSTRRKSTRANRTGWDLEDKIAVPWMAKYHPRAVAGTRRVETG